MRELIRLDSILTDDGEVRRCERPVSRWIPLRELLGTSRVPTRRSGPCGRPAPFLLEPSSADPWGTFLCEEHARAYESPPAQPADRVVISEIEESEPSG